MSSNPYSVKGDFVCTAAVPAAARTGLDALRAGGNAFDAALAACFVETVWLPMKCGLAGDLVALMRTAEGEVQCLTAIGGGPVALGSGARLEKTGPCSVGAPGAPIGYATLAERAVHPLSELIAPAAAYAEAGIFWTPVAVNLTREAAPLLKSHNSSTRFLPEGMLPQAGEPLHLPGLARLLGDFANKRGALFHGDLGEAVVARVKAAGGFISLEDMKAVEATLAVPLTMELDGSGVARMTPAPSHGLLLAKALEHAVAQGCDSWTAFITAREVLTAAGDEGTSVVTAADNDGNGVVVVHSNSFPQYGSSLVLDEYDLVLNNRPGRGFDLEAPTDHWNAPAAGRIPFTTLQAWALERPDGVYLGGTPGGQNQAPWNLQTILDLLDGAHDLGALVTRPRWGLDGNGAVLVEKGCDFTATQSSMREVPALSLRSAEQVIRIPGECAPLEAAADPRTGALALAGGRL
ncbi:gamma-glutamyltransferase [Fodinicurvata halophila]|uniref:Gamma-glutamyltransferase n=1 Tax=Fodinicurvata halophila TaxID=1419723 RepID=A0ABV8UHF6_9PROT